MLCGAAFFAFSDYQYSLWGLKEGSIEWLRARHEVHNRCAYRLQELCFRNGGIYIKLGQHIGQLVCFKLDHLILHNINFSNVFNDTLEEHVI